MIVDIAFALFILAFLEYKLRVRKKFPPPFRYMVLLPPGAPPTSGTSDTSTHHLHPGVPLPVKRSDAHESGASLLEGTSRDPRPRRSTNSFLRGLYSAHRHLLFCVTISPPLLWLVVRVCAACCRLSCSSKPRGKERRPLHFTGDHRKLWIGSNFRSPMCPSRKEDQRQGCF